jgi:hypothetical protein
LIHESGLGVTNVKITRRLRGETGADLTHLGLGQTNFKLALIRVLGALNALIYLTLLYISIITFSIIYLGGFLLLLNSSQSILGSIKRKNVFVPTNKIITQAFLLCLDNAGENR